MGWRRFGHTTQRKELAQITFNDVDELLPCHRTAVAILSASDPDEFGILSIKGVGSAVDNEVFLEESFVKKLMKEEGK